MGDKYKSLIFKTSLACQKKGHQPQNPKGCEYLCSDYILYVQESFPRSSRKYFLFPCTDWGLVLLFLSSTIFSWFNLTASWHSFWSGIYLGVLFLCIFYAIYVYFFAKWENKYGYWQLNIRGHSFFFRSLRLGGTEQGFAAWKKKKEKSHCPKTGTHLSLTSTNHQVGHLS